MASRAARFVSPLALVALGFFGAAAFVHVARGEAQVRPPISSGIISWEKSRTSTGKWGEFHSYFTGDTFGTTNMLVGTAVVKPGEEMHGPHRHAEEEFLIVTEGSGRFHLDGKEYLAQKGDVLYAAPWVMHSLSNNADKPITYTAVKWANKGVTAPPEPAAQR